VTERSRASLILPVVSGVAIWLSFPDVSLVFLAWVGLIPYLWFLVRKPSWPKTILGHLLFALPYFGGVLYWIPRVMVVHGGFSWPLAVLLFVVLLIALAVFLFPFTLLVRLVAGRSAGQALICAPGFWLLTEVLRNYFAVNGFPWGLIGYSQYPYLWLIQVADLGGVYLVSYIVVLGNAALLAGLKFRRWRFLAISATILVVANLYGVYRAYLWRPARLHDMQVALVQADVALAEDTDHYATKYFEAMPGYYRRAAAAGADLVVFPEAQNPYLYPRDFYYRTFLERMVASDPAYLIFNSSFEESKGRYFNSAFLLGKEGKAVFRYDKVHLVPFGEYVPAAGWLDFFEPLVREVSAFTPGAGFKVARVGDVPVGTMICYEGIFPEIAREFQRQGAQLLVIITNDAWYGRTAAAEQHLQIAAFRAIENRRFLLRAANSGYSAVIDELGRFRSKTKLFEEDLVEAKVTPMAGRSIYSYTGEWLNIVLIGLSLPFAFLGQKDKKGWARGSGRRKGR